MHIDTNKLSRAEIAVIIRRHKGTMSSIADELGIRPHGVCNWADGKSTSARIDKLARIKAAHLLRMEAKQLQSEPQPQTSA